MKNLLFSLSLSLAIGGLLWTAPTSQAQTTPAAATPAPVTAIGLWRCTLPGGSYEVAVRSITAVSMHEYVIDNVARVTEVNIDTAGNLLARFYFIEPNAPNAPNVPLGGLGVEKAQQIFTEAANRTGQDAWKKVVKSYPTTTHAHTAEFRLDSKEDLQKLYDSVEGAFRLNKAGTYKGG